MSHASGDVGDAGLAQTVESLRLFFWLGGTSANLIEDLTKEVNQMQTLKGLLKTRRGLLDTTKTTIPKYKR